MTGFLGIVIGVSILLIPPLFWPQSVSRLSSQEFIRVYPTKKWIYYLYVSSPVIWVLLYAVFLVPTLGSVGNKQVYFVSFLVGGGLAVVHGIVEILTSTSMRNFSRGGSATYAVDDAVKRLGWVRLGLVLSFGLSPWIITLFKMRYPLG
jgi:hypothetical protein